MRVPQIRYYLSFEWYAIPNVDVVLQDFNFTLTSLFLQLHFVSYNTKYEGLMKALPHADGLAVLGVMIEVQ